jgi:hypothetical protein
MNNQNLAPRASYNGTAHRLSHVVNRLTSFQAAFSHWIADFVTANALYGKILEWNSTYAAADTHMTLHLDSYHASPSVHNLNALNNQLTHWDTNNMTNVGHIFDGASGFNMPMNQTFDTQNVVNMHRRLNGASEFNQHDRQHLPSNLDTRHVFDMGLVFSGVPNLNQPLGVRAYNTTNVQSSLVANNVSYVTAMSSTFERATQFNPHPPFSLVTRTFMSNGAYAWSLCIIAS